MTEDELFVAFANPEQRAHAAAGLAALAGGHDALLFVRDPLLEVLLPAPGFRQTLPDASWRRFLDRAAETRGHTQATLPYLDPQQSQPVLGIRGADGSVLALIGATDPRPPVVERLQRFLPLLAAAPRQELLAASLERQAVLAAETADEAHKLAQGLERTRAELDCAYHKLRQAERELSAERERLSVTLHSIGDAVISTDTEGRITLLNAVAEECTGWKREQALGRTLEEVFPVVDEYSRAPRENPVSVVLRSNRVVELANHTVLVRRDGSEISIDDSGAPIRDSAGRLIGVVLVFRDITKKRRLEDELIKTQRLESIGVLAGGIAHDFNNILTAVLGNIGLAKLYGAGIPKIGEVLQESENAFWRARELTQQLLTFAKGGAPIRTTGVISSLLRESIALSLGGGQAETEVDIAPDLWPVGFDSGQMSQVFNNLFINAREAMPAGGRIHICAYNEWSGSRAPHPVRPGRYVHVTVQDEGTGIPEAVLPHIFEPFFTTKAHGSGLGLATVYSIISRHEGYVFAKPAAGRGTVFHLFLPAAPEPAPAPALPAPQRVRILVIEHEPSIASVSAGILEQLGYDAVAIPDPERGFAVYRQALLEAHPFALVILDIAGIGGHNDPERLKPFTELDPHARVLACSGNNRDSIMAHPEQYGFAGALAKPYRVTELETLLLRLLGPAAR